MGIHFSDCAEYRRQIPTSNDIAVYCSQAFRRGFIGLKWFFKKHAPLSHQLPQVVIDNSAERQAKSRRYSAGLLLEDDIGFDINDCFMHVFQYIPGIYLVKRVYGVQ